MVLERKVAWIVVGGATLLGVVLLLSEKVEDRVAPQPHRAFIAIETPAGGSARTGRVEIAPGTAFTLHAVLEAVDWSGDSVYYTDTQTLQIDGVEISTESLRKWDRDSNLRLLWFTVEGFKPYLALESNESLDDFHFEENFRPSWPRTWSIPGSLQGSADAALRQAPLGDVPRFGTQRYHLRIEFFGPKSEITPEQRIQSLGAAALPEAASSFATVVASLPGRLAEPSSLFGVTQIELGPGWGPDAAAEIESWSKMQVAFSKRTVIGSMLRAAGRSYEDLQWQDIDISSGVTWGESGVESGDLLRVGERWVVLLADTGESTKLDRADLCLDYDKGPRVRTVGEIFVGDGLIEWTSLGRSSE